MDSEIIRLMQQEPSEGLQLAIKEYLPIVKTVVKKILRGQHEDAEECVADTFVKFWETAQNLDPDSSSAKAYLVCIARNTAINRYHYLKRRKVVSLDSTYDVLPDATDVELEFLKSERNEILLETINHLPDPNREIIIRRFFLFESVKQIASALGMTDSQISNKIYQSKLRLSKNPVLKGVSL